MGRICEVFFSGTGTTEKVCDRFTKSLKKYLDHNNIQNDLLHGYTEIFIHNITPLKSRNILPKFFEEDIIVIGVPTIAGRVPNLILPYLEKIKFNNAICIPIVLFGNRNYDDSLIELSRLIEDNGGRLIAGAAVVGEHSFSETLAKGRPNKDDLEQVDSFAESVSVKILKGDLIPPKIKGSDPLRDYFKPQDRFGNLINFVSIKPKTNVDLCDDCKECVSLCPLDSINYSDVSKVDGKCMKCCACIKKCHMSAKYFDDDGYTFHKKELEELYKENKKNEFFI